jgi:hypothetical protein
MALLEDVYELFDTLDRGIERLNASTSYAEFQDNAVILAQRLNTSIDWGNATQYIDMIDEGLSTVRQMPESASDVGVELINDGIDELSNYLERSWWQFGGVANVDKRDPLDSVPVITYLERFS